MNANRVFALIGALAAVVPFAISVPATGPTSVMHSAHRDWVAVGGGAIAVLAAVLALRGVQSKPLAIACAVIALVGGFHVARGYGAFG